MVAAMDLHEIPTNISWKRRVLTTSSWYVLAVLSTALLPVVIPLTALYDLVTRNRLSTSRTALFFTYFFVVESLGLTIAFWLWIRRLAGMEDRDYEMANRRLQRWWARALFWGSIRIYSCDLRIDGLEHLEDDRPAVVMSRHASTLDTMLPIAAVRQLKSYRFVIKTELLADPALDYVGQRFPNVFVDRGSDRPEREIEKVVALGSQLQTNEAVVIYPEGTRFSESKRERLLEKFEDDEEMLSLVEQLENTLPPLRRGGIELLASTPEADAVFIAHRGIEAGAMSDLVTGKLTGATIEVRIWRHRAEDVPRTEEQLREFLVDNWKAIDRFIAGEAAPEEKIVDQRRHARAG